MLRTLTLVIVLAVGQNAMAVNTCNGISGEEYEISFSTKSGPTPEISITRESINTTWTMKDKTGFATLTMLSHSLQNTDDAHRAVFSKLYLSELIKFNNQMQPGDPNKEIVLKMIRDIAKRPAVSGHPAAQISDEDLKTFLTKIYPKYPARHFPITMIQPGGAEMTQDKPIKDVLPLGYFESCQSINAFLHEPGGSGKNQGSAKRKGKK